MAVHCMSVFLRVIILRAICSLLSVHQKFWSQSPKIFKGNFEAGPSTPHGTKEMACSCRYSTSLGFLQSVLAIRVTPSCKVSCEDKKILQIFVCFCHFKFQ